jgi:protein-disulfide isomerase
MKSGRYASRIEFSRQEGISKLVDGTPTFYINGKKFDGPRANSDVFKAIADSLLARRK